MEKHLEKQRKEKKKLVIISTCCASFIPSRITNDQAFVAIQVVEQVQLFRMGAHYYHFSI